MAVIKDFTKTQTHTEQAPAVQFKYAVGDDVPLHLVTKNKTLPCFADKNLFSTGLEPRSDAVNLIATNPINALNELSDEQYNQLVYHLLNRLTSGYFSDAGGIASFSDYNWFALNEKNADFLVVQKANKSFKYKTIPNKEFNLVFLAVLSKKMQQTKQSIEFKSYKNSNEAYLSPNLLLAIITRTMPFSVVKDVNTKFTFSEIMHWIDNYEHRLNEIKTKIEQSFNGGGSGYSTKEEVSQQTSNELGIEENASKKQNKKGTKTTLQSQDDYSANKNIVVNENNDKYFEDEEDNLLDIMTSAFSGFVQNKDKDEKWSKQEQQSQSQEEQKDKARSL